MNGWLEERRMSEKRWGKGKKEQKQGARKEKDRMKGI